MRADRKRFYCHREEAEHNKALIKRRHQDKAARAKAIVNKFPEWLHLMEKALVALNDFTAGHSVCCDLVRRRAMPPRGHCTNRSIGGTGACRGASLP